MQGEALVPDARDVWLHVPAPAHPAVFGSGLGSWYLAELDPGVAEQGIQLMDSPVVQPSCKNTAAVGS